MRVLVLGSGGREDALCWKLKSSPLLTELFCAPGNPGTARYAKNVDLKLTDIDGLVSFAKNNKIDLTIVGPELPLTIGVADAFEAEGLKIFGPNKEAAQLEGSKSFTKDILVKAQVPTAAYAVVYNHEQAQKILSQWSLPYVLKADGLAAGKGVVVCHNSEQVQEGLNFIFNELKADQLVLEQFLSGVEASFIVATDGERIVPMASSHDYKRIYDKDQGPNTGGMGTVSPSPRISAEQEKWVLSNIIKPTLTELNKRGIKYKGFMYAGLMISESGEINVIEYNARLGDPETQVIMSRANSDLLPCLAALSGVNAFSSQSLDLVWSSDAAVCVVMAAKGYPQKPVTGDEISGIQQSLSADNKLQVFHAGTKLNNDGTLVTAGGRVLNVTACGADVEEAREKAYKAVNSINFEGKQFRQDIGLN